MKLRDGFIPAALIVFLTLISAFTGAAFAQTGAVFATGSFAPPVPIEVAPGGIITIFVAGLSPVGIPATAAQVPLPTVLGGISAYIEQFAQIVPVVPLISVFPVSTCFNIVSPSCATLTGIRLQIPFEITPNIPGAGRVPNTPRLFVKDQAGNSAAVDLNPFFDRIHILTFEDKSDLPISNNHLTQPLVTHANGSLVTPAKPAKAGEQLVAYAVGLGQTDPFPVTGAPSPSPAPRATTFLINYAFSPNALPSSGLIPFPPTSPDLVSQFPVPTFAGLSPGSVGLYQLNFIVPAVPAGTLPCGDIVHSNLTVSFVGTSIDGAPICVAVP